jgi:diguanylate cyclase (GGDEF)-like protein
MSSRALERQDNPGAGPAALRQLGTGLGARAEEVVAELHRRGEASGRVLGGAVEESFARITHVSTVAVARWLTGGEPSEAREVGREAWQIFGQLAAQREVPLNEVTKRCLRWRDATADVLREEAGRHDVPAAVLAEALTMVQRSLDVTLVRMCQSFEAERQRMHGELEHRQDELTFLATHDPLTGLPNRNLVLDRIEQMFSRARRGKLDVAALFIDLDNFKSVNDTLGHSAGDELLRAVTARLRGIVRETDTLGRLGGDEFVILAEGLSLAAGPELIAERLLEVLAQPFTLGGHDDAPVRTSASVGIAVGMRSSPEDLLRDADIAMYRAKRDGKGRCLLFESEMQVAIQSRVELEMDLRVALEREQFRLVYQPILDLGDMTPTGMEALLRWHHPQRGVIAPAEFIPILEESGLIRPIGRWVLREACRQGAAWQRAGQATGMSVNVSARQLDSDGFVAEVRDALESTGFDAAALTLEVTETTLMHDTALTARRLTEIKVLGVRIAIDDFGTGYSSLAYLRRFPVDALKIDRSFITRMADDQEGETLIRMLVELGKGLCIETLAEGIESPDQLDRLRRQDCDTGQGFLFARPLDPEEAGAFLRASGVSCRR